MIKIWTMELENNVADEYDSWDLMDGGNCEDDWEIDDCISDMVVE